MRPHGPSLLREWLYERELTRVWLARRLRLSSGARVSQWCHGWRTPSLLLACAIQTLTDGDVPACSWIDESEISQILEG